MFTSSMPDEGKSETAFALASSFGNIGKKVLLVDADIRKSVMVKRYEIKGNPNGLSQYLSGQKSLEEICYKTDMENLDMAVSYTHLDVYKRQLKKSAALGRLFPME